jgi:hypothetical protein
MPVPSMWQLQISQCASDVDNDDHVITNACDRCLGLVLHAGLARARGENNGRHSRHPPVLSKQKWEKEV